jgi:uncharacterized CHY-type Zn-finger protein
MLSSALTSGEADQHPSLAELCDVTFMSSGPKAEVSWSGVSLQVLRLYYASVKCHAVLAGHEIVIGDKTDYETLGALCRSYRTEFTTGECLAGDDRCPNCKTSFNQEIKGSDRLPI